MLPFLAQHPAATVVMEACGSAHYWGRQLTRVHNKAAVAVANKLARVISAVWTREKPFELLRKAA